MSGAREHNFNRHPFLQAPQRPRFYKDTELCQQKAGAVTIAWSWAETAQNAKEANCHSQARSCECRLHIHFENYLFWFRIVLAMGSLLLWKKVVMELGMLARFPNWGKLADSLCRCQLSQKPRHLWPTCLFMFAGRRMEWITCRCSVIGWTWCKPAFFQQLKKVFPQIRICWILNFENWITTLRNERSTKSLRSHVEDNSGEIEPKLKKGLRVQICILRTGFTVGKIPLSAKLNSRSTGKKSTAGDTRSARRSKSNFFGITSQQARIRWECREQLAKLLRCERCWDQS